MFSSFPKILDRNFVFSYLLPVVVTLEALLFVLNDIEPFSAFYHQSQDLTKADNLTLVALFVAVVSVVLMMVNHWLYQILEGYVGPLHDEKMRGRYKQEFVDKRDELRNILKKNATDARDPVSDANKLAVEKADLYEKMRLLLERFPANPRLILATRLGNAIRSFEAYPLSVYGIDSIVGWFRLQAVVPKPVLAAIDDARAKVDFCINVWTLALVVAAVAAARCVWALVSGLRADNLAVHPANMAVAAVALVIAWGAYKGAIALVVPWGGFVKTAFDLYLPALAQQMGYQLPDNKTERRAFWEAVNEQFLYWQPIDPTRWPAGAVKVAKLAADGDPAKGETGDSDGGDD